MLGTPSIMVLTSHLFDRGTWDMASFSHMKAYGQSTLSSASSTSLWAASPRVCKQAWWGCAQILVRPKTLSHPMVRLGAIKRNAMSHWGFPTSPHAPAMERMFSCACVIAHTWKLFTSGQRSCDPHLAFVASSNKLASVERSMKSPIVVCNESKRIS